METPPGRKQLTHDRIVDTAARALRRGGFASVGVADIMKQAGLTHGGFYAHFPSREALLAEALDHAGSASRQRLAEAVQKGQARGASRFRALVESYLSEHHLKSVESGCPVAALSSELPRQGPQVRALGGDRIRSLLATVQEALPAGSPADAAPVVASQLVGALQLARTLGDNAQGRALLAASRQALLARFDPFTPGS
jgi:AcrR family transcriptional regulator